MTLALIPLILCFGGVLLFALLDGKASTVGLVCFAVGLWHLVSSLGGGSVHVG